MDEQSTMNKVSVIIPCYNHGEFLKDSIESVLAQTMQDFEIIIVDDGSTDSLTKKLLSSLEYPKTSVISTPNQGLAAARNNGIAASSGSYILPLDADDKIGPEYLEKASKLLDEDDELGIVYCKARLFGALDCDWALPPYSLEAMLKDNVIFCTALFRRADWELSEGYDVGMIYGWEDYEFWLSLIERGRKVVQLNDQLFYYRVSADSMVRTKEKWQKVEMFARIYRKHSSLFSKHIEIWLDALVDDSEPYFVSQLYYDSGKGFNESESITRKIIIGDHQLRFDLANLPQPRTLRFDPIDRCGNVRVNRIYMESTDGSPEIDVHTLASNADCVQENNYLFSSDDPQIFIPIPMQFKPRSIEIDFSITSIGERTLREIIMHFRDERNETGSNAGVISKLLGIDRRAKR